LKSLFRNDFTTNPSFKTILSINIKSVYLCDTRREIDRAKNKYYKFLASKRSLIISHIHQILYHVTIFCSRN